MILGRAIVPAHMCHDLVGTIPHDAQLVVGEVRPKQGDEVCENPVWRLFAHFWLMRSSAGNAAGVGPDFA